MAASADATHMTTVSRNRPKVSSRVMTIGSAVFAVIMTMTKPMLAAREKPMTALSSAWLMMTLWIYTLDDPMARSVANSFR